MTMKRNLMWVFIFVVAISGLNAPAVFAKKDGAPAGWSKGQKKGWQGQSTPPGWSKKDGNLAAKEARKKVDEAEKAAKKAAKKAGKS